MGTISLPEMRKYGYADRLSTGAIAFGGTLGILIPPSTPMIIYCIMAEESIGKQFIAGILPGILLAILGIITIVIMVKLKPSIAPKPLPSTFKEKLASLPGLWGVVVLFGAVLGGMFSGFFSVNQAAAVGAFLALILCVVNRTLNWGTFKTRHEGHGQDLLHDVPHRHRGQRVRQLPHRHQDAPGARRWRCSPWTSRSGWCSSS